MSGPAAKSLSLSDHERSVLVEWVRRPTSPARLVQRSRIVLAYADSGQVAQVARQVGVSAPTVTKWRDRFLADRLDGLEDAPRPGQPRKVSDEQIEALISRTLDRAPPLGDTHWSTRSMAADQGLNQTAVSRIWRAFGLKPHAVDSWKLSKDPDFVDKVRDIVGLYMSPPENALVLAVEAVDEKSQVPALDRTAPIFPMLPTTPARATHDYVRHGTTSTAGDDTCVSFLPTTLNHELHHTLTNLGALPADNALTQRRALSLRIGWRQPMERSCPPSLPFPLPSGTAHIEGRSYGRRPTPGYGAPPCASRDGFDGSINRPASAFTGWSPLACWRASRILSSDAVRALTAGGRCVDRTRRSPRLRRLPRWSHP